jgi:hypothetical protein
MRLSAKEEGPVEVRRDVLRPVSEQVAGLAMAGSRAWFLTASA